MTWNPAALPRSLIFLRLQPFGQKVAGSLSSNSPSAQARGELGSWGVGIKRPFKFQLQKSRGGLAKLQSWNPVALWVPIPQVRNSAAPPPALGELQSWALMAGPVVVPGQPDQSLLVKAVRHTEKNPRVPPRKLGPKLADPDILHRGFGDRLLGRL